MLFKRGLTHRATEFEVGFRICVPRGAPVSSRCDTCIPSNGSSQLCDIDICIKNWYQVITNQRLFLHVAKCQQIQNFAHKYLPNKSKYMLSPICSQIQRCQLREVKSRRSTKWKEMKNMGWTRTSDSPHMILLLNNPHSPSRGISSLVQLSAHNYQSSSPSGA